jgi:tetracycline 7-halogenase / FADH2 O2-dependent halogenase
MATGTASDKVTAGAPTVVRECDVVILGSGLAGSVAGAILARHGADVMLVDAASHPRFAIGESMTGFTEDWLNLLSERFDVPEIKSLATVKESTRDIGPFFGVKAHFGFALHHPRQESDPTETWQFALPAVRDKDAHLYRQASDAFMFQVAARYGCTPRQNWRVVDIDFDDDGVTVTGHTGEVLRGKYLIDASGFRSPLAQKLGLRETPTRFKHHSRSLFTHYVGIKPFDEVSGHPKRMRPPVAWHRGTMHHLIDRGWFWIIPFDSYQGSKNPLCSVGLTFDERVYPKPRDMTPEQEFQHYLDMYPAIRRQFEGARRVREWVSTDRIQYSSRQTVGDRWCLTSHAAGFIDPLYSRGLSNTFEVINALVARVLDALKDGDFSAARFEYVERLEQGLLQFNDDIVNSSFISFSDARLWNAMFRVWGAFHIPGGMRVNQARMRFAHDKDDGHFRELENAPYPGLWFPVSDEVKHMIDTAAETCEKYEAGEMTADTAADILLRVVRESKFVTPVLGWKDPEQRLLYPTAGRMAQFMYWNWRQGPPQIRPSAKGFLLGSAATLLKGISTFGIKSRKLV